jgi:hypothetical protein
MTVSQKRLSSDYGFKSPGFGVDINGNLTSSSINSAAIAINGTSVFSTDGASLSPLVTGSSLEQLGTLTSLTVNGTVAFRQGSTVRLSVTGGRVVINSGTTGTIDNVDIGGSNPGVVTTYQLNVVDGGTINANNVNISMSDSQINGTVTFIDDLIINTTPTQPGQATRKDYVDNASVAFAIAFGV